MVAVDADIVAGFRRLWAQAGLATLVSGGLHWTVEGIPATTVPPYAELRVKADPERIETATPLYVERWMALVEVYTATLRADILRGLARIDRTEAVWPPAYGRLVKVQPGGYEPPDGGDRPHARDEYVLRAGWTLWVQQRRDRGW